MRHKEDCKDKKLTFLLWLCTVKSALFSVAALSSLARAMFTTRLLVSAIAIRVFAIFVCHNLVHLAISHPLESCTFTSTADHLEGAE